MWTLYRAGFALFVAAVVVAAGPGVANASAIYDYTGNDFTLVSGPYTTADSIMGSLTLSAPLGDNLNLVTVTPSAFSFSDGVQSISASNGSGTSSFLFSTDATGNITQWDVNLCISPCSDLIQIQTTSNLSIGTFDLGTNDAGTGINNLSPGVWSSPSVTPLPGALPLFATGLGLTSLFGWRRKRKSPAIAA